MAKQVMTLQEFTAEAKAASRPAAAVYAPFLRNVGLLMVSEARLNIRTTTTPDGTPFRPLAHPRPAGGDKPLNDRGLLAASISSRVEGDVVRAGTNRVGAALHLLGGIVRAVRRKFLTIPLTKQAQRSGGARRFPGELSFRPFKGGQKGALVDEDGTIQFLLVKSVKVPARPYLGFGKRLMLKIDRLAREFMASIAPGGK